MPERMRMEGWHFLLPLLLLPLVLPLTFEGPNSASDDRDAANANATFSLLSGENTGTDLNDPSAFLNSSLSSDPPDPFLEEAEAKNLPRAQPNYRANINLRILDGRKNFLSEANFQDDAWKPKHWQTNKDLNPEDYNAWKDFVISRTQDHHQEYLLKLNKINMKHQRSKWLPLSRRPYPFCVDGIRPFAHEVKRFEWARVKPLRFYPRYGLVDDDLYRFAPYFQMAQTKTNGDGHPFVTTQADKFHQKSTETNSLLRRFEMRDIHPPETRQGGLDFSDLYSFKPIHRTYVTRYMPGMLHLMFGFHTPLQGLFLQAIGYPMGLPFGVFSDDFECDPGTDLAVPKMAEYRQRMHQNHPHRGTWKINTVIPCKYNYGNNNGAPTPTVYAYGGNRKTQVENKFDTFRIHFQYLTSDNCKSAFRFQFLVLAVKSFINAEFEVFFTRGLTAPNDFTAQLAPPYIEDWKGRMLCTKIIDAGTQTPDQLPQQDEYKNAKSNPFMSNHFGYLTEGNDGKTVTVVHDVRQFNRHWMSDVAGHSNLPIPYDRSYDECIQDVDGKLLDKLGVCPPKNLCFDTDDEFHQWTEKAQEDLSMIAKFKGWEWVEKREEEKLGKYWNPVSVIRFVVNNFRHFRLEPTLYKTWEKCQLPFCRDPRETIPFMKAAESEMLLSRDNINDGKNNSGCATNDDIDNLINDLQYYKEDDICKPLLAAASVPELTWNAITIGSNCKFPNPPPGCPYSENNIPKKPDGTDCKMPDPNPEPECPFGPNGPYSPNGPYGPGGPYSPGGPYGPFGPYGPKGPYGPFGPEGPYSIYHPYGPYAEYGPYGIYGPYGMYGPYGKYGPYGYRGPFGLFGPGGPGGPGGPPLPAEDRWDPQHSEGMFRNYVKLARTTLSTHVWCMVMAWFVLLSIATFTARYYKETGGIDRDGKNGILGLGLWLWIHIAVSLLAMTLMWVGISESMTIRRKPPTCNLLDQYASVDIGLKNFCRWRKQVIRTHQILGYVSVVAFHIAFLLAWTRPARTLQFKIFFKVKINVRKICQWGHFGFGYFGKLFAFISVMSLLGGRSFAICVDIPILVILIEIITIIFYVLAWLIQVYEDRKDQTAGRRYLPEIEAITASDSTSAYPFKLMLFALFVGFHLMMFSITWRSIHMLYHIEGHGANDEAAFETRQGIFASCKVPSRQTEMKALEDFYEDRNSKSVFN